MATQPDSQYFEEEGEKSLEFYSTDEEYLSLRVYKDDSEFDCRWTPGVHPFEALARILPLGFISLRASVGLIEANGKSYESRDWNKTLIQARQIGLGQIDFLSLGTDCETVVLFRSPFAGSHCCGFSGSLTRSRFLGTALTLTASPTLITQYRAMHARLISLPRLNYMITGG